MVTNSIKTLKMVHIKKKFFKKNKVIERGYKIQLWRKIQRIYKLHSLSLTLDMFSQTPSDHLFDDKEIQNFRKDV